MLSSPNRSVVSLALIALVVCCLAQIEQANANIHCPQMVAANDGLPKFCAANVYGQLSVSRPEFENWNCNHPFNKYVKISDTPCAAATGPTCTPATCDQTGPTICARLASPDRNWPNAYTTAIFGNQCQLTLYNCLNPTQIYVAAANQNAPCTSIGL